MKISNSLILKLSTQNVFSYIVILTGILFLFAGGPDYYSLRSIKHLWDLGHIVLFAYLTKVILFQSSKISTFPFLKKFIILFFITFIFGVLTEVVQVSFNRTLEYADLYRDILGFFLGFFFVDSIRLEIRASILYSLKIIIVLLLILELAPLTIALYDEYNADNDFPTLSNFESSSQIGRWESHNLLSIDKKIKHSGNSSLKVVLKKKKYSGLNLKYFPHDWQGYKYLYLNIHNFLMDSLEIHIRIHDNEHLVNKQPYNDRFHMSKVLETGWNEIAIPLKNIKQAPKHREMDMGKIISLGIFVIDLSEKRSINLDDIYLVK